MADEVAKTPPVVPAADEQIKNLKAEFDRKLGNLEKGNQALITQLQALAKQPAPKPQAPKTPLKDLWYDDPDAAAAIVAKTATDETLSQIRKANDEQTKKGNVIQGLYREYPELQDFDNPLTVKAVEIFEKYSDDEKSNPIAYKLAVKEAADELDIKPKARRKPKEEDDFVLSGGKGEPRSGRKTKEGLDPRTVRFAEMVGLDVKDEKVLASIKNRSDRKNWMTWE